MRRLGLVMGVGLTLLLAGTITRTEIHQPTPSPKLLALGKQIYTQQCAACHGTTGQGDGEAAYLLFPKPRDLVAARY